MLIRHRVLLVFALAGCALAQTDVGGPVLGFVFDRAAGGVRPIPGVPGAARLGDLVDLGAALSLAEFAPGGDYGLAVAAGSGDVLLLKLEGGPLQASPLPAPRGPDRIALSPRGGAAALYYHDLQTLRLLTGLPDAPALSDPLPAGALPGPPAALAVSDDAGVVLLAATDGEGGWIFTLRPGEEPRPLLRLGGAAAIRFLPHRRDALVADAARDEILLLRDVTGAAESLLLAGARDGVSRPVAVAPSADGRRAFAASAGAGNVLIIDMESGAIQRLDLESSPSSLTPLKGGWTFLLTEASASPPFLLDAAGADPRIVWVPPPRDASSPIPPFPRARRRP